MIKRESDLEILKPMDIWILAPLEEPPSGAALYECEWGRIAFRPKGENDETAGTESAAVPLVG